MPSRRRARGNQPAMVPLPRTPRSVQRPSNVPGYFIRYGRYVPALQAGARLAGAAYRRYTSSSPSPRGRSMSRGRSTSLYSSGSRISAGSVMRSGSGGRGFRTAGPSIAGGRFTKPKNKNKKNYKARSYASQKGILATYEVGGIGEDSNALYIGHCTCPPNRLRLMMYNALVKALLMKMDIYPAVATDAIPYTTAGDKFVIQYRTDSDPGATIQSMIYLFVTPASPADVADSFATQAVTLQFTNQVVFVDFNFIPEPGGRLSYARLHLLTAKLAIESKSSFKIQNRSVNEEGDINKNDVDNVPLYGKTYGGMGTGTQYVTSGAGKRPFICHNLHGVIAKLAGTDDTLKEPPIPHHFSDVKKVSKNMLDPGQMKTSVLYYKSSVSFSRLLSFLYGDVHNPDFKKTELGKFVFFGLERMIHSKLAVEPMQVAYEHNLELSAYVKPGRPDTTARVFGQSFYDATV